MQAEQGEEEQNGAGKMGSVKGRKSEVIGSCGYTEILSPSQFRSNLPRFSGSCAAKQFTQVYVDLVGK